MPSYPPKLSHLNPATRRTFAVEVAAGEMTDVAAMRQISPFIRKKTATVTQNIRTARKSLSETEQPKLKRMPANECFYAFQKCANMWRFISPTMANPPRRR